MKRDIFLSVVLHLALFAATVVSSPFDTGSQPTYDEVIRVSLFEPGDLYTQPAEPVVVQPLQPAVEEPEVGFFVAVCRSGRVRRRSERFCRPNLRSLGLLRLFILFSN